MFKPFLLNLSILSILGCTGTKNEPLAEPLLREDFAEDLTLSDDNVDLPLGIKNSWDQNQDLSEQEKKKYWDISPSRSGKSRLWQKATRDRLRIFSRRWVLPKFQPAYRKPSVRSEVVSHLIQGDEVWVQSIHETWARLRSGAWVPVRKLSSFPPGGITQPWQDVTEEEDLYP